MQFQRLRLSGFKSFVDATEFHIEPGLTGVVGPNGCGKSNLLEALRWVMGATSAKAMRGEGMDDVIFGGAEGRPARSHAEVLLQIDNADHGAPVQFNTHSVIEVTRRIDRGAGSTYRVNGVETRARDVQLLFADASTGANSPALVRQGQISELIAAKPSNRRRILEEAAGVSGLHSRRHEAELRLKAAEANLERLSDVAGELEAGLVRLRREARQAEKYRRIAAEIRHLQAAVFVTRWREAEALRAAASLELEGAGRLVQEEEQAAREASDTAAARAAALKPAREEAVVAAAVHQKLLADQGRLDLQQSQALAELSRAKAERRRILEDLERESLTLEDAEASRRRLASDLAQVEEAIASAPSRAPELREALAAATAGRAAADQEVVVLSAAAAAGEARREAAKARLGDAQGRSSAARFRLAETRARAQRAREARQAALGALEVLGADDGARAPAIEAHAAAAAALEAARTRLEICEAERAEAVKAEDAARIQERAVEDRLQGLRTEAEALGRLLMTRARVGAQALDEVRTDRGFEAALAAALGEDLDAGLDAAQPRHWAGADVAPPTWPQGARPLSEVVAAPPALMARLAYTALVETADGERLRREAPPGARLVSKAGDLWRWDGFTARADAQSPAAARLEQRARLEDLRAEVSALIGPHEDSIALRRAARARLEAAEADLKEARAAPRRLEPPLEAARLTLEALTRQEAQKEAKAAALRETIARLEDEEALVKAALAAAEAEDALAAQALSAAAPPPETDTAADASALGAARLRAIEARAEEARLRALSDQEERTASGRLRRRETLQRELGDWERRAEKAGHRAQTLRGDLDVAQAQLSAAEDAPAALAAALQRLLDALSAAEARRRGAEDALSLGERAAQEAERALRVRETALSRAREARAAAEARAEGARGAEAAAADNLRRGLGEEPQTAAERLGGQAFAVPSDAAGVETLLSSLERDRDAMGPVNLRAEDDAQELGRRLEAMSSERQDLTNAIARLRAGVHDLNEEGRDRLQRAFGVINGHFQSLFETLFEGGRAELRLIESDDPLEAGLEIFACPPGKRLAAMSLMSGGEQALTAASLIFAVFLANPSPVCVLDEVDAPLDDANVDRFCRLLDAMRQRTQTRFIVITHNPVTMSRVDRLFGVTMPERGISQLVSINLRQAEALAAE